MKSLLGFVLLSFAAVVCSNSGLSQRIINGIDSEFYPYVVVVVANALDLNTLGGGSFITKQHVLTQAKLIDGYQWWGLSYGASSVLELEYEESVKAVTHPDFDPVTLLNDIGIIFTTKSKDSSEVDVIPLPYYMADTPLYNEQGTIRSLGHNSTEPFDTPHIIQETYQRVLPAYQCRELLGDRADLVTETHFCAIDFEYSSSLCLGDMGAGFVVAIDKDYTLTGVASFVTNLCNSDFPTVYTKVSPYVEWIEDILKADSSEERN